MENDLDPCRVGLSIFFSKSFHSFWDALEAHDQADPAIIPQQIKVDNKDYP
jgi:hypothetical protein